MLHQGQRLLLQLLRGLAVYVSDFYLKKKKCRGFIIHSLLLVVVVAVAGTGSRKG